ncbi:hypothetical protein [Polyangium jinanense]|uniref:Uncharacterized protein n=1 Tax=Polyangium jinanense TaxID=2829994 RepID=A0A9X3XEP6_9BACT|nr:hypothetical protein [Polyangium jinanense]MDC3959795.1 hypothetical protein [Polyangium jinanense]MDC3988060.1 hypothetical protein [Polyangium jinanense]
MGKHRRRLLLGAAIGAIVAGLCPASAWATNSYLLRTQTDASGLVTVAVFERIAGNEQQHFQDFAIDVPPDFVAVGGGIEGTNYPAGNLITASYANDNLSAWMVSSKDHSVANPVRIRGYAIGLKISPLSREELMRYIQVAANSSGFAQHPDVSVGVPGGYVMIGGGMKVEWMGAGNLATASYPETPFNWRARSKDHEHYSPANLRVYAIGLAEYIPGVGRVRVEIASATSGTAPHPSSAANISPGFALTGGGALVHWSGAGNLLWRLKPITQGNQHGFEAASKDHNVPSPATITTYALGIRIQ